MKLFLIIALSFSSVVFAASNKVTVKQSKLRAENAAQWNECKKVYKDYMTLVRERVVANKRIPMAELLKLGEKLKPGWEVLIPCQADGFLTEQESENVLGGATCLNFFNATPAHAKSTNECKDAMKPDSF